MMTSFNVIIKHDVLRYALYLLAMYQYVGAVVNSSIRTWLIQTWTTICIYTWYINTAHVYISPSPLLLINYDYFELIIE